MGNAIYRMDNTGNLKRIRNKRHYTGSVWSRDNAIRHLVSEGDIAWGLVADTFYSGIVAVQGLQDMIVLNNEIYAGGSTKVLLKWNGINAWEKVATSLPINSVIYALCPYNNKIYIAGGATGILIEWTGINTFSQVANELNSQKYIYDLCVFNEKLYGCTGTGGRLFEWNGSNAWVQKGSTGGDVLRSLCVHNEKLYAASQYSRLYEWNGVDTLTQVAPQPYSKGIMRNMLSHNNKLYGASQGGSYGNLLEWNDVDAWEVVCNVPSGITSLSSLVKYKTYLYCSGNGTNFNKLYQWDGVDTLIECAGSSSSFNSQMVVLDDVIYQCTTPESTENAGKLYKFESVNWERVNL